MQHAQKTAVLLFLNVPRKLCRQYQPFDERKTFLSEMYKSLLKFKKPNKEVRYELANSSSVRRFVCQDTSFATKGQTASLILVRLKH